MVKKEKKINPERALRQKRIDFIMKDRYSTDSDKAYDSNLAYLESLSDDELDHMSHYKY